MRYIIYFFVKITLLLFTPALLMVGTIIGLKFLIWLGKRKVAQLDRALD